MNKIAFCTLLDNKHVELCKTMLWSWKKNCTQILDFIIFTWEPISEIEVENIKKIHSNVIFKEINTSLYEDCLIPTDKWRTWNYNPFYRFEIFSLKEYDKIIYIDCDVIINKDLSEFINFEYDLYASPLLKGTGMEFSGKNIPRFNAGVMGIGKRFLNDSVRMDLIRMSEMQQWSGNQTPLNLYFQNNITFVDIKFNLQTDQLDFDNVDTAVIIHFIGDIKPISDLTHMTLAYPLYCIERSKISALYKCWNIFKLNYKEMNDYVDKWTLHRK